MAANPKPWTGALGNVVISTSAGTFYGLTYNNPTTTGTVVKVYDNATTNSGTILWQGTLTVSKDTVLLDQPIHFANGITVNVTVQAAGAGSIYVS